MLLMNFSLESSPQGKMLCAEYTNSNQKCHVYLDKSTDDFQFVSPEMCVGVPKVFVSALYEHSGVLCV